MSSYQLQENHNEEDVVFITGEDADGFWQNATTNYKPLSGLKNISRKLALKAPYWIAYHVETTEITEKFRTAQDQKNLSGMKEETSNIKMLLLTTYNQDGESKFFKPDSIDEFKDYLKKNSNSLLVNFNGFRFADLILESRGVDVSSFKAIDLFLEIYRCVSAAASIEAIQTRRGWNFDTVIQGTLNQSRPVLEKRTWDYLQSDNGHDEAKGFEYAQQTSILIGKLYKHIADGGAVLSPDVPLSIELRGGK